MSYNETLKSSISSSIKTPANPKITGAELQAKLLAIVDAMDSGGIYLGVATPETTPVSEANCFYLAVAPGTYTHFLDAQGNAITIVSGESALISTFITQENQQIRWTKSSIVTPSTPNGYVAYAIQQELSLLEKLQARENIGAAAAEGEAPDLIAGDIIPKSSSPVSVDSEFTIQPTGGDTDLKTGTSWLRSIRGNLDNWLNPFMADTFVSTAMNLVDPEQTLTIGGKTAYYFPIAKGTFGTYGTTQENNGYIIVGDTPFAVYYSPKRPTASDYGTALTPVNSNRKQYYTTTGNGWLVVIMNNGSEIPAVHLAWSNYKDDIGGLFDNRSKEILPFVQWIHPWGMAALFGPTYAVFDEINIPDEKCYRRIDRVALNSLTWEMTVVATPGENDERDNFAYLFTATVSGKKTAGLYKHNYPGLEVEGNTVKYLSTDITTVPDFVISLGSTMLYFELATVVERTFAQIGQSLTTDNVSNDFGLTYFLYRGEIPDVPAYVNEMFQQGGKDPLFNAVTYQKILAEVVALAFCQVNERVANLEKRKTVVCENLEVKRRAKITGWCEVDSAPASESSNGKPGDFYIGTEYLYICVANNTWRKTALSNLQ